MAKGRKLGFFACFVFMAFLLLVHGPVLAEEVQADPSSEQTQTETVSEESVADQTSDVRATADETQTDTTAESETTEETQTDAATDPETTEQSKENAQTGTASESKLTKQATKETKTPAKVGPSTRGSWHYYFHKENLSGYLEVHIRKTDDKGNALKGATLQITDLDNNGQPAEFWMNVQGKMVLVPNGTFVVNEDPITIYFKRPDLDDNNFDFSTDFRVIRHFRLSELEAPDGYEKAEPLDFELNFSELKGMNHYDDREGIHYVMREYLEHREHVDSGRFKIYLTDWIDENGNTYTGGHIYNAATDEALLYPILVNGYGGHNSAIAAKYLKTSQDSDFAYFLITQFAIYHKLGTISDEMILNEIQSIIDVDQERQYGIFPNMTKEEIFAIVEELANSTTSDRSFQIISLSNVFTEEDYEFEKWDPGYIRFYHWVALEQVPTFCLTDRVKDDHGVVRIRKYGSDTNGKYLSGAKFQIIDADGKIVKEFVTGNEEMKIVLPIGTYTLHEVSAPNGYQTGPDQMFEVVEDKITKLYGTSKKVKVKNAYSDRTNLDWYQAIYRDPNTGRELYALQFAYDPRSKSITFDRTIANADSVQMFYDNDYRNAPQHIIYNSADFYKAIIYILTYNYKFEGLNGFQEYYIKQSILSRISYRYFGSGLDENPTMFNFKIYDQEIRDSQMRDAIFQYIDNYANIIMNDLGTGKLNDEYINTELNSYYFYYYFDSSRKRIMVSAPMQEDLLIKKITNRRNTGYVKIHKYASDTHQYLAGATMQIIDQTCNVVRTFVTNGQEQTIELPFGTYTLHEVSAPQGYNVNSDVTFTVNSTEINLLTAVQRKDTVIYDENGNVLFVFKPSENYDRTDQNINPLIKVKANENMFNDQKDPKLYYESVRYWLSRVYPYTDSQSIDPQLVYLISQVYVHEVFRANNDYVEVVDMDQLMQMIEQYSDEDVEKFHQEFSTIVNDFDAICDSDDPYAELLKANENAGELYLYYAEDGSVYVGIEPAGKTVMTIASAAITDEKIPEKPEEKKEEKKQETKQDTKTVETATAHGVQTGTFTNSLMWMMLAAAAAAGIRKIHDIA
ncbi:MSCRAMM family protein [Catenisphaera adipataccumulans]|uniref:Putative surface anchored protein n=1 Tax=Catenisphaera adipataccumulans TaxID=700500 RepID=A0A7W8CY61_9FIRM|nr:SpaA isopeptide-forming pilin-related protein [Catenisphaera adipataccumulans]MBB5182432.1 putative surface anchored protein [Catenisphaera adipataccumulans]